MRILWQSNSRFSPSGYGNQTNLFVPALKRAGHEPAIFAFYGQQGNPSVDADGITTLPPAVDTWGNDVVGSHMDYLKSDLVITLIDPFVLDPNVYGALPWCAWAPIDSTPILPGNIAALKAARWIWAMSRFGERELKAAGFQNVTYVPHGVDTEVFKPIDRATARKRLARFLEVELEGKFLVAYNAANTGVPPRKGWYECLAAFKLFSDDHPDAALYCHTERDGRRGVHLPTIMAQVGLDPSKVIFAPQYNYLCGMLPAAYLNDVYNAADVYFHPSHGEGFGIPLIEAQAAGCPVITCNSSAMTELSSTFSPTRTTPFMDVPGRTWRIPNITSLEARLSFAYKHYLNGEFDEYRLTSREFALGYDRDTVLQNYMLPALEAIDKELNFARARQQPITIPARREVAL